MHNQGIGSWSARRARKSPHRVAVTYEGRQWTYGQLHERVLRLAHALRGLGVRRGDRVAYLGANHPAFLETLFAAGTLGAVFVPLNTRLAGPELAHCLSDSAGDVLVYAPEQERTVTDIRDQLALRHVVALGGPTDAGSGYEDLLAGHEPEPIDEPVAGDDPCMIMYTSGTTGRPKGATLTHTNITWNSINVLVDTDLAGDEVALICAPLFHTAGLNMICLPTLLKGGTAVLVPAFDAERMLELVETRRVTFMFGVPAMFNAMAASPRWPGTDLSSLRILTCGGAPVPEPTIRTYQQRGLTFLQGYGLTETAPGALFLASQDALAKAGSAGMPHFFTDVRVVRDDMTEVEPDEKGEIVVQGPNVMTGYWGLPDATASVFSDGAWFHSGDVAVADEDGYFYVVDRLKDVIISGGENVYPAEVEDVLYHHPDVADVAVIGVPDQRWGEVGRAVVARTPDAQATEWEILDFLHGRLANYKIPKSVRFVDELPRNASGKVLKKQLREVHGAP